MEVKHDLNATKKRMKELARRKNELEMKIRLEEIFKMMCECDYRTLNLNMNNGYELVCTILERENNDNGL